MVTWWEYLVGFVILIHGLSHLVGAGIAFTAGDTTSSEQLGLFARLIRYQSPLGKAWVVFWLAASGLLLAAAVSLMTGQSWWSGLAMFGALASLVAIVPWWELWNPAHPEPDTPLMWPAVIARWWKSVAPGTRAGLLLDVIILVVLGLS